MNLHDPLGWTTEPRFDFGLTLPFVALSFLTMMFVPWPEPMVSLQAMVVSPGKNCVTQHPVVHHFPKVNTTINTPQNHHKWVL